MAVPFKKKEKQNFTNLVMILRFLYTVYRISGQDFLFKPDLRMALFKNLLPN